TREQVRREELEAAKEAKYLEIRDAEMDYRTGKLSEADFKALDRQLRGEAVEILRELDQLPCTVDDDVALLRRGSHLGRPDLPRAHALREGRGAVGRVRRGHGRRP